MPLNALLNSLTSLSCAKVRGISELEAGKSRLRIQIQSQRFIIKALLKWILELWAFGASLRVFLLV